MLYVLALEDEGAGYALQRLFGGNPAAAELLGPALRRPEPLARGWLDVNLPAFIRAFIRACRWERREYAGLIVILDGGPDVVAQDPFIGAYRAAGAG